MNYKSNDLRQFPDFNPDNCNPEFDKLSLMLYFYYVIERLKIQQKKDAGEEFPWTSNPILRDNSFTCNRREDDRTTKWLLNHISNNPDLSFEDRVLRSIIFRLYNRIDTAELIGLDKVDFWDNVEESAIKLENTDHDVYTRAYKTVSTKYQYKDKYSDSHNWKSWTLLGSVELLNNFRGKLPEEITRTAPEALDWLKSTLPGVGGFVGMQLLIDLMYIDEIPYSNNEFVICGPGAKAGLDRLFINKDGMSYEQCIYYIRDKFNELYRICLDSYCTYSHYNDLAYSDIESHSFIYELHKYNIDSLSKYICRYYKDENAYCVTDIQNTFCEYSKFRYLMENKHKNPRKYIQCKK